MCRQRSLVSTAAGGARLVGHQVTTSPGGKAHRQLIDTRGPSQVDPNPAGDDFVYDGAGRLTTAYLNGARAGHGYGARRRIC